MRNFPELYKRIKPIIVLKLGNSKFKV